MTSINGWLNIYKPRGISSAAVVAIIKRTFKGVKTGHAGTLDPLAEGILPIALGEATKLTEMLIDAKKTYQFTIKFGSRTSSGDIEGSVIATTENLVKESDINDVLHKFIGEISQVPPAFSAIKINGVRAYKLARAGDMPEMKMRQIHIYDLKLLAFNAEDQTATLICECSKGTYIRTLAEDIGFSLQNLGHVIELKRLGVGKFTVASAANLSDIQMQDNLQRLSSHILPVDFVLDDILVINVSEDIALRIRNGQKIIFGDALEGLSVVYCNSILYAIGIVDDGLFKIKRVFNL